MAKITIIHPNCDPKKIKSKLPNNNFHWFSFGEEFNKIEIWNIFFGTTSKKLNVAKFMEDIYFSVSQQYSNIMADIGLKYNDVYPEWWLSPVSEKNGWPPKYVVNKCAIEYLKKRTHDCDDEIIFISSSVFNLVEIQKLSSIENVTYSIYGYKHYIIGLIQLYFFYLLELLYFGFEFIKNKAILHTYSGNDICNSSSSSNIVLIRTHCHESSFKDDGQFKDLIFGDLKEKLQKKGFDVVYQPNLSLIQDKKKIYRWLNDSHADKFWILENTLTLADLAKSYVHIVKQFVLLHRLGYSIYLNLEPSLIVTTGNNYLKSLVPVKLSKQKIEPGYILFDWENKAYEKYMCILAKKYALNSKMVGYVSGIPFPTGPRVNLSRKEAMIVPLPNKIVCCSQYVHDWLEHVGFDNAKLSVGPSIRQNHIFDNNNLSNDDFILVALPLNHDLSFELIAEMVLFARHSKNHNILLKPHPFLSIDPIMEANAPIPDNISISNEDMSVLFQKCQNFVYVGPTTTACEAFVLGKNVCRYISNNTFSLDCLSFKFNDQIFSFTKYTELDNYIAKNNNTDKNTSGEYFKRYIFNEVEDEFESAFVFDAYYKST